MHFKISSNEQFYKGNTYNTFSNFFFFFYGETCDFFRGAAILYISIDRYMI